MLYMTPFITVYCCVLAFMLGAVMASFLNCMAYRIVHGESVLKGRSHCDVCGHELGVLDLIPIFSYLFSKGRCRYCKSKLSSRHLWLETISAIAFLTIILKYDISFQTLEYLIFTCLLMACAFADLEGTIIPDRFIIAGLIVRLGFILVNGNFVKDLLFSLIGGFTIPVALLIVVLVFEKITKKDAMGGGDIKLLFMIGLFIGWKCNVLCLLLACIIGIVFGAVTNLSKKDTTDKTFPFGPSIVLAAWICILIGDDIIHLYLSLF